MLSETLAVAKRNCSIYAQTNSQKYRTQLLLLFYLHVWLCLSGFLLNKTNVFGQIKHAVKITAIIKKNLNNFTNFYEWAIINLTAIINSIFFVFYFNNFRCE